MKKPVLIVIDMMNDSLRNWEPKRRAELVHAINDLVGTMHRASLPVIWIRQEFEPDLRDAFLEMRNKGIHVAIRGTEGCQIASDLVVQQSDVVIVKKRYSAFYGTPLDDTLAALKPDAIILAGVNTHACIRTTAIDAYQRDWPVIVASDCTGSYDREHHAISLRYMKDKIAKVMTNRGIQTQLSSD